MFLAMNKFKIVKGREEDFEKIWRERDTHLQGVEGFKEFNLMKGSVEEALFFICFAQYLEIKRALCKLDQVRSLSPCPQKCRQT
jgi:hypothetical protein